MSNHRTTTSQQSARPPRRSKPRPILWSVLSCLAIGLLVVGGIVLATRQRESRPGDVRSAADQSNRTAATPIHVASSRDDSLLHEHARLIDDDQHSLWVSPTEGPPVDLAYLPPGVQIVASVRWNSLVEHPEGEKVIAALGPLGARGEAFLKGALLEPAGIERVTIGGRIAGDGVWGSTLVARLSGAPFTARQLAAKLPNAVEKRHAGQSYWLAGNRAYYLPKAEAGALMVVASEQAIADIIDLAGEAPPLRRDIERLLAHTDADRHVNVVLPPKSLFNEGRGIFDGELARLRDPLFWFLGDELSAAALSMHWDENFFLELIATPTLETSPERAARILAERVATMPHKVEHYVEGLDAEPYSRAVVRRFPAMIRQIVAYARQGFEPDHAVLRCYLPVVAGHNLLMGAELTLAHRPGGMRTDAEATAQSSAATGQNEPIRDRLQRVTSLRFARDSLESALEQLAQDIGVEVVIRGPDLQAEGITKNQSFGVDAENMRAEEILIQVLRLANPDKTASSPADPRQKLVYTIARVDAGGREQIVVTTRAAAAERGEELPAAFTLGEP